MTINETVIATITCANFVNLKTLLSFKDLYICKVNKYDSQ